VTWLQLVGVVLVGVMFLLLMEFYGEPRPKSQDLGDLGCAAGLALLLGLIAWVIIAATTPTGKILHP
jgi:hypothetical protein